MAQTPHGHQPPSGEIIDTTADTAFLMDFATGTILFSRNPDKLIAPASMAKLMTQEVVFNEIAEGRLTLDTQFSISENAWRKGGGPSGTSSMFAVLKSKVAVRDLLRGSMIVSANDACIALAEGISGSEETFARKMTERARALGMKKSVFTNSTGLPDPGLKVTPRELVLLADHIIRKYPEYYQWYSEKDFLWTLAKPQLNRNPLIRDVAGADGMKTGYTKDAGYSLVGSAIRDQQRLVLVVGGLKSEKERAAEARKLIEWGFRNFETRLLVTAGDILGTANVYGGSRPTVSLTLKDNLWASLPRGTTQRDMRAQITYKGPLRAPLGKGTEVANLRIYVGGTLVREHRMVTGEDVETGSFSTRALDAARELIRLPF